MSNVVTINLGVKKDLVELDLPTIKIASTGQIADVIEVSGIKNGNSITFTVRPRKTEDADCEVIDNSNCIFDVKRIDDRLKELGALEDIECEII